MHIAVGIQNRIPTEEASTDVSDCMLLIMGIKVEKVQMSNADGFRCFSLPRAIERTYTEFTRGRVNASVELEVTNAATSPHHCRSSSPQCPVVWIRNFLHSRGPSRMCASGLMIRWAIFFGHWNTCDFQGSSLPCAG